MATCQGSKVGITNVFQRGCHRYGSEEGPEPEGPSLSGTRGGLPEIGGREGSLVRPAIGALRSLYWGGSSIISSSSCGGCISSRSVCRINRGGALYVATPAMAALLRADDVMLGLCQVSVPSPPDEDPWVRDSNWLDAPVYLREGGWLAGYAFCIGG